jgi:hypothetical protein
VDIVHNRKNNMNFVVLELCLVSLQDKRIKAVEQIRCLLWSSDAVLSAGGGVS